jgi:hypothetical protein
VRSQNAIPLFGPAVAIGLIAAVLLPCSASAQTPTSVTCSPSVIAGGSGNSATCTVTLSGAAPAGGTAVTLASSLIELAASLPRITVAAGQTTGTFTVTTNARYRAYSALGFTATITASANGTSRSTTVSVTAQPRPADFTSGSQAGSNTQWSGLMCGGIAPIGGQQGILYNCSPAQGTGFGTCTFQQECSLGCRRVPPGGGTFNDFCATSGPNSVAISRNYVVSGDRVPASIVLEAPAGNAQDREQGAPGTIDTEFNSSYFPHAGGISFPIGATSVPFDVATSYVPSIQFVDVVGFWFNASIPPFLITNGRAGHVWLVMVPPDPAPSVALPTLGDFFISGLNPITGGDSTFGQVDLSGISRAGGPTLTLTSSDPAIVPSKTFVAPVSENLFGFQGFFDTNPVSTDTNVTVTLTDGRYSFSDVLTVRAAPPPPVFSGMSVNPSSVVGGNSAIGTVTLSAPQSGATVVKVSIIDTAPASLPGNDPPCPPSSRCYNVTVPASATSANFAISTQPVTSQFNLNIFAESPGSPNQQTLLLITAGGPTTAKDLTINPNSVVGGRSATGTVTLSGAAPSGGAVVTLSKAFSNGGAGTVPATIPASVTVPAGQTSASFAIGTSAVTATTNVRISGTYKGVTANADMTLFPLLAAVMFEGNVPGGNPATGTVALNGPAPSGGTVVSLSSGNTSLVTVPPSVTVPAGQTTATFTANTAQVTQTTAVVVSASAAGTTVSTNLFLVVSRAVSSVTLSPSTLIGPGSSTGTVTLRSAASANAVVELTSSNSVFATVPFSVVVPSGQTSTTFTVNAAQVTQTTSVVISATYENVTKSATLTINPSGSSGATLSAVSLNPASVAGGSSSTGTVTLSGAAPAGGVSVSLSDNSTATTVPASVTVPAGAASANFTVTTTSVTAQTTATISAASGGVTRTAALTVNPTAPPPPGVAVTLTVNATGRSGERVTSSPAGINVAVGGSGSASFNTGTSITLSVSNGRDAIWSGACSSGGNKRRTCTFTINGTASVSANVQ